ncbi:hypothetical protein R5H28_11150 [Acinetobacter baumannii]|nr:hypothetical protein [Acinetobacter baumannii]MDW3027054.1 hypothetical protein [Acinetobacter baumannii]
MFGIQKGLKNSWGKRLVSLRPNLSSAWFGAGANLKQRGLEQALRMVS